MNTQKALVTVVLLLMCLMSSIAVASNRPHYVALLGWGKWESTGVN